MICSLRISGHCVLQVRRHGSREKGYQFDVKWHNRAPAPPPGLYTVIEPTKVWAMAHCSAVIEIHRMEKPVHETEGHTRAAPPLTHNLESVAPQTVRKATRRASHHISFYMSMVCQWCLCGGDDVPAFLASASFSGARRGYVFKAGNHGVGYYRDTSWAVRVAATTQSEADAHCSSAKFFNPTKTPLNPDKNTNVRSFNRGAVCVMDYNRRNHQVLLHSLRPLSM